MLHEPDISLLIDRSGNTAIIFGMQKEVVWSDLIERTRPHRTQKDSLVGWAVHQKQNPPNGSLGTVQVLSTQLSPQLKKANPLHGQCRDGPSPPYLWDTLI